MNLNLQTRVSPADTSVLAASRRDHLLTVAFGLWMTIGLFLDGYFHQELKGDTETFLTPWHAVFYAGFLASALWLAAMSRRRAGSNRDWRLAHLPPGYDGARLGLVLFALGGIGDASWHAAFGVERGVDALLSPTHLLLFVGLVLILTAPLRAGYVAPESAPGRWLGVGSLISATALVGFFLNFVWGLGVSAFVRVPYDPVGETGETEVIAGVASMLVTTIVLFVAARILLLRLDPPAGAFTALFGAVALLVSVAFDEDAEGVLAAVATGMALDAILRRRSRPLAARGLATRFGAAGACLWLVYFGLLAGLGGIEWQAEIALGAIVLSALAAYGVAALQPIETEPAVVRQAVRQR